MKKMLKKISALTIASVMIFSLAACGGNDDPAPAQTDNGGTESEEPAEGGGESTEEANSGGEGVSSKDTITIALDREPVSLDPPTNSVNVKRMIEKNIYDTLLQFDEDIVPSAHLAQSWERVDDVTWQFNLRQGVKFHNGDELTANDVVFSIDRIFDSSAGSSNVVHIDREGLEAVDDYTVIIRTTKPYALLESLLCSPALSILPEKVVTELGDDAFGREPIGSGPYKFASWTAGDNITLERNDEYWGEAGILNTIICRIITESASATIDLESGGIDMVLALNVNDADRIAENPETQLITHANMTLRYIAFNTQEEVFSDPVVRQALYHATDTEILRKIIYGEDTSTRPTTPVMPGLPGRKEDLPQYEYDPEKAKAMLTEAGKGDGFSVEFMYLANATNNMLAELLQEMWKAVDVDLVLMPTESGALTTALNKGEQELCSAGTSFDLCDATEGLYKFFHTDSMYGSSARTNLSDPEVDRLLDEAIVTSNPEDRIELLYQAQERIHELAPMIYLANPLSTIGAREDVRGFDENRTVLYSFSTLYFAE